MSEEPRRVVLLRHGQTGHNAAGVWQGQMNTQLSDLGRDQARRAAQALAALRPAVVVTSDLRRAADTAAALGRASGLGVRIDPRLREIHAGSWQGMSHEEVARRFPAENAAVRAGEDIPRGGSGERVVDVVRRARPALDDVVSELAPGDLGILVTHGVTARALTADALGLDQRLVWTTFGGLGNARWATLTFRDGRWRLQEWNAGNPDVEDA